MDPDDARVRVSVRLRPFEGSGCIDADHSRGTVLLARSAHGAARQYTFDDVFDERATNSEHPAPLVRGPRFVFANVAPHGV